MAQILKQSTAIEVKVGPFLDNADGFTAETTLTITQAEVLLAKNAGDWAQKNETTSLVHESNGWYRCLLDATDTNTLGMLMLQIAESGALPVWETFWVVTANVFDTLFSTGILDVNVTTVAANALTAAAAAADFSAEIADAVLDEDMTAHQTSGTLGGTVGDNTTDAISIYQILNGVPSAAQNGAAVWNALRSAHVAIGSFGQALQTIRSATAQAGGAATITLDAGASAVDDQYNGLIVLIVGGTGEGQFRQIADYVGSTKVATVTGNWTTQPDATSIFVIVGV